MCDTNIFEIIPEEMLPLSDRPERELLLKLYQWTEKDALKAEKQEGELHGLDALLSHFPSWLAAQQLKAHYLKHKKGDKRAVLDALSLCLVYDFGIPRWCRKALIVAYAIVDTYEAKSWDDVFGKPHPKNTNMAAQRDKWMYGYLVYREVKARKNKGEAIDREMYERISKDLKLLGGSATVERYYREWNEIISV